MPQSLPPLARYPIELDGHTYEATVLGENQGVWRLRVDDEEFELRLPSGTSELRPDLGHVLVRQTEGHGYTSAHHLMVRDEEGAAVSATLWQPGRKARTFSVRLGLQTHHDGNQRRSGRARNSETSKKNATGAVSAPMNGQVFKILREVGTPVNAGDVILVLEAMKMENEVTTAVGGVLTALQVRVGETVKPGQALFEVSPSPEST